MGTDNLPTLGRVLRDGKWENLGQGSVRVALELGTCGWMLLSAWGGFALILFLGFTHVNSAIPDEVLSRMEDSAPQLCLHIPSSLFFFL